MKININCNKYIGNIRISISWNEIELYCDRELIKYGKFFKIIERIF